MVNARLATLHEIETFWTVNEVADANEVLDIRDELERREVEKLKRSK